MMGEISQQQECSVLMLLMMTTWWWPCDDDKAKDRDEEALLGWNTWAARMFHARLCQTKHSIVLAQQIPKTQSVIFQILLHSPLGDKTKCEQNNCNKPIWYLTSKSNLIKLSSCADQAATGGCECLHNRARFKILKMVRLHSHHGREGGTWALLPGKSFCRIIICLKSAKDS